MRELLADTFTGNELHKLEAGTSRTKAVLRRSFPQFRRLTDHAWQAIDKVVYSHFTPYREGVFGGQITVGEGWFIGAWMSAMRPSSMLEIGVASGYASALILSFAEEFHLLQPGTPYLYSIDAVDQHDDGNVIGSLMHRDFKNLLPYWSLQTNATTATLQTEHLKDLLPAGPEMALLDGDSRHPWAAADLALLQQRFRMCPWVLLNNVASTQRWLNDAIMYGTPVPPPAHGAQLAASLWPGHKVAGTDMCFNIAALNTQVGDFEFDLFCQALGNHPAELSADQLDACEVLLAKLGYRLSR